MTKNMSQWIVSFAEDILINNEQFPEEGGKKHHRSKSWSKSAKISLPLYYRFDLKETWSKDGVKTGE
jgi:hypothetical protein